MEAKDILGLSLRQLGEKKVRTALTVLMVIIGVASIVALTSQTAGTSKSIQSSLASLGPTSIIVTPSAGTTFTDADIDNLETLQNVSSVIPILTGSATFTLNGNSTSIEVVGVSTTGLQELLGSNSTLYQGAMYNDSITPSAVIGHDVAFASSTDSNLQTAQVGETATISVGGSGRGGSGTKTYVPITGILQSYSASIVPVDSGIIVSMPFAQVLLHKTTFNEIVVKAANVKEVSNLSTLISTIYGTHASVRNTEQLASTVDSITNSTTLLFTIVGGISLVVAAIGIMNVMLMAVSERIHDIGILKSVGFKSKDVMMIFLLQALFIGMIGGFLGLGMGIGASYAISALSNHASSPTSPAAVSSSPTFVSTSGAAPLGGFRGGGSATFVSVRGSSSPGSITTATPVFTPLIMFEAIAIAIAISAVAGIYPAWKASRMEPIDALRIL